MTPRSTDLLLPQAFKIVRIEDPAKASITDPETELTWLPIVGPSVWVMTQRCARYPTGQSITVGRDDFAYSIGLSPRRLEAVVTRGIMFDWFDWHVPTQRLYVATSFDPPKRQPMRRAYPENRGKGVVIG